MWEIVGHGGYEGKVEKQRVLFMGVKGRNGNNEVDGRKRAIEH